LLIFFCLVAGFDNIVFSQSVGEARITSEWLNASTWRWHAQIPAPQVHSEPSIQGNVCQISCPGLENQVANGLPNLPVYTQLFNALPEEITYQINGSELTRTVLPAPLAIFYDQVKDGGTQSQDGNLSDNLSHRNKTYPSQSVQIVYVGKVRGTPLTKILIFPYRVSSDGREITYYINLEVRCTIQPNRQLTTDESLANEPLLKNLPVATKSWRREIPRAMAKVNTTLPVNQRLVKISVNEDGIYRISKSTLRDSSIVLKGVDPRTFRLFNKGKEVPLFVNGESDGIFNDGDYLEFFGQRLRNSVADYEYDPFTSINVYWLTWGGDFGLRYAEESAQPTVNTNAAICPTEYLYTKHIEENRSFERLGQVDVNQPTYLSDHWFFDGGISGGTTQQYTINLIYPNPNTTKNFNAWVRMHGLTYQVGNHDVTIYVNNKQIAQASWSAQTPKIIENESGQVLYNNFLTHGANTLQIAVSGSDPTNRYDKVLFDWVKIQYYRLYKAYQNEIDFYRPQGFPNGLYQFTITDFQSPDISIYKVGKSKLRDFEVVYNPGKKNYSVTLQDNVYDDSTLYWAAAAPGIKKPYYLRCDTLLGLANSLNGANIVIIAPEKWIHKLDKLENFYRSIGLEPRSISVTKIYNEFNHGIVSPFAIKRFLQYVYANWRPVPEYVLLIGKAELQEQESVPAFFFQSYKFGACASDFWYALVDEDEVPDFAIGRWPCRTEEELQLLIKKRIAYTKNNLLGEWNNELLFIAGMEDVFKVQSENMIQRQIDKAYNINRIYINPTSVGEPFFGNSDSLINLFNRGVVLGNFMGHGGGAVWADRSLFNTSHIKYLNNLNCLPFLTSLTCFTADFTNVNGLGFYMLLAPNGGAIGLWGATSVGWIKNDYLMAKPFYDVIFQPGMSVGKAIQIAKIKYLTEQDYFDYLKSSMLFSYNLIGDPTVVLPFPQQTLSLKIDKSAPAAGDTLTLTGTLPFNKGELYLQVFDSSKYRLFSEPRRISFNSNNFKYSFKLPENLQPGGTYLNYYLHNSTRLQDAHGVTFFDIRGLTFYGFACEPARPAKNSPFDLVISTELTNLRSLVCRLDTVGAYEYLDENGIEHVVSFQSDTGYIELAMTPVSGNSHQWHLTTPLKIGIPGKLIALKFTAFGGGVTTESQLYAVRIKSEPDFIPLAIRQGGVNFPELIVDVKYIGDDTLNTTVQVERLQGATSILFGNRQYRFLPNRINHVSLPGVLGTEWSRFQVVVDPENRISESNENNNSLTDSLFVNTFPVLPGIGSSYDGKTNDTLTFASVFKVHIAPDAVTDSAVIILASDTLTQVARQPDFRLCSPLPTHPVYNFKISLVSKSGQLQLPAKVITDLSALPSDERTICKVSKWHPALQIWLNEVNSFANTHVVASTSLPGIFGITQSSDVTPPKIEINLEGQKFFENSYVADKPSISVIGEDNNGVRFDEQGLSVLIDGSKVNLASLNIADTLLDGRFVSAQFRPTLNSGKHTLEVRLLDAAGNLATAQLDFTVSDALRLIDYGNYPNPFKDRTTFIYELTQRVPVFKIKIYSVSGRLIRVLEESNVFSSGLGMNEGGYHEVVWNGQDSDGNFVANGVYFYKMVAQKGNKIVSSTGKIAKAR